MDVLFVMSRSGTARHAKRVRQSFRWARGTPACTIQNWVHFHKESSPPGLHNSLMFGGEIMRAHRISTEKNRLELAARIAPAIEPLERRVLLSSGLDPTFGTGGIVA